MTEVREEKMAADATDSVPAPPPAPAKGKGPKLPRSGGSYVRTKAGGLKKTAGTNSSSKSEG